MTAFLSVGSKAAGFVVLMRVIGPFLTVPALEHKVVGLLAILAFLSLIYGNLAAMPQDNVKRMLAYSSIGHAGYLLVAVASVAPVSGMLGSAGAAVSFYLAAYLLMTLLAFIVLIIVAKHSRGDDLVHFNGLAKRSPFLAFGMLIAMLSLAGLPFTAGFMGKFMVFAAALQAERYWLVAVGAVSVAAGFYYYLRVVGAMYWQDPSDETRIVIGPWTRTLIGTLAAAIIFFGVYPRPILNALRENQPFPASAPLSAQAP